MVSIRDSIESKISGGKLSVEDILEVASSGDIETALFLRRKSEELKWDNLEQAINSKQIPFADWIDIVIEYLTGGFQALALASKNKAHVERYDNLIIGLLEHLHSLDSLRALLTIYKDNFLDPGLNFSLNRRIATALNRLLSFDPQIEVPDSIQCEVRDYLHYLISLDTEESARAVIYCALREVGDLESINLIKKYPKLKEPWEGVEQIVIRKIKARQKRKGTDLFNP